MLMPNLETDLTGDVLKASPSLVVVERVVRGIIGGIHLTGPGVS